MALVSLQYVKDVLEISSSRADTTLSAMLAGADRAVKDWCGRELERVSRTWYPPLRALGRNNMLLPERPVWVVSDVRIDSSGYWGVPAASFPASSAITSGVDYTIRKDSVDGLSSVSGMLVRLPSFGGDSPWSDEAGIWPRYDGGVKIVYEGGWYPRGGALPPTMPGDIELAVALLMKELWMGMKHGGSVESETNFGATYVRARDRLGSMSEPQRLLAKYREA